MIPEAADLKDSKPQPRRSLAQGPRRRRTPFVAAPPVPLPRARATEAGAEQDGVAPAGPPPARRQKPPFTPLRATVYFTIALAGVFATLSAVAGLDRLESWRNAFPGRLISEGRQFPLATWRQQKPVDRIVPAHAQPQQQPLKVDGAPTTMSSPAAIPKDEPLPRRKDAIHPATQVEDFHIAAKPLPPRETVPVPPVTATPSHPADTPIAKVVDGARGAPTPPTREPVTAVTAPTARPALSDDEPWPAGAKSTPVPSASDVVQSTSEPSTPAAAQTLDKAADERQAPDAPLSLPPSLARPVGYEKPVQARTATVKRRSAASDASDNNRSVRTRARKSRQPATAPKPPAPSSSFNFDSLRRNAP